MVKQNSFRLSPPPPSVDIGCPLPALFELLAPLQEIKIKKFLTPSFSEKNLCEATSVSAIILWETAVVGVAQNLPLLLTLC